MASRQEKRQIVLGAGVMAALFCAGVVGAPSGCFLDSAGVGTGGASGQTVGASATSGSGGTASTTTSSSNGATSSSTNSSASNASSSTNSSASSSTASSTNSSASSTNSSASSASSTNSSASSSTTSTTSSTSGGGCNNPGECPGGGPCATASCTNHVCGVTMTPPGNPCTGQTGICDASGACVNCIATPVQAGCPGSQFCVGGLCCNSACTGVCQSCSLPGLVGTCTDAPWGETTPACGATSYCENDVCFPVGSLMPLGSPCTVSNYGQCVNRYCGGGACKLRPGAPCARDVECGTSLCANGTCAMCSANSDCSSGQCYMSYGLCEQAEGSFCDASYECVGGACNNGVCSLQIADGQACTTSADCASWLCKGGTCAACTTSDCASCSGGVCLAPSGTPCRADSACDSGKCTGTPPYLTCM